MKKKNRQVKETLEKREHVDYAAGRKSQCQSVSAESETTAQNSDELGEGDRVPRPKSKRVSRMNAVAIDMTFR